jgi:heme-degrading monooxygenase HmoA
MRLPSGSPRRHAGLLRSLLATSLLGLLGGCAIGTPLDVRTLRAQAPAGPLQVSITHATVDPARRAEFNRWTRRVNADLDGQPGLLLHSIRRELLGDQAWTFTVWASAEDRERFVRSTTHRRAMAEGSTGIAALRTVRVERTADALPEDWDAVLALLEAHAVSDTVQVPRDASQDPDQSKTPRRARLRP